MLNKVFNEDCLIGMQGMMSESVDLIVTDPPYKIITGGDSNGVNSIRPKGILSGNRELMKSIPKIDTWIPELFRILKNGSHCYIMVNSTNLISMATCIEKSGFKIHNFLVWKKNNNTPSQFYMKNCEYIIFCRKGKAKYINNMGDSKTVHDFNNILGNKIHPTQKPIDLIKMYILNSSSENDVVFDPFMGSGTTAVAAMQTGRNYIGFEMDAEYFDVTQKRIDEWQKKQSQG